jgi:hypothetical protein
MSALRGRVIRLERREDIKRRYAAIFAEIARRDKVRLARLVRWRRQTDDGDQSEGTV